METLLEQLGLGQFTQGNYYIVLQGGAKIWTANGLSFLEFYPTGGKGFTFLEKLRINKAIKQGRLAQLLTHHID